MNQDDDLSDAERSAMLRAVNPHAAAKMEESEEERFKHVERLKREMKKFQTVLEGGVNAMTNTVTIEHPEQGQVAGVEFKQFWVDMSQDKNQILVPGETFWSKDGRRFYASDGWREVSQEEDVTGEVEVDDVGDCRLRGNWIGTPVGFKARKLNAVVLPEEWRTWSYNELRQYLGERQTPVLKIIRGG